MRFQVRRLWNVAKIPLSVVVGRMGLALSDWLRAEALVGDIRDFAVEFCA